MVLSWALRLHWVVNGACRPVVLTWLGPAAGTWVSTLLSGYSSTCMQNQATSFAAFNLSIAGNFEYIFKIQRESTCRPTCGAMIIYHPGLIILHESLVVAIYRHWLDTRLRMANPQWP